MINSVSFGSNQEQKSHKTRNTLIGAGVGAAAAYGIAAAGPGKSPIVKDAATLKGLSEDQFKSTMEQIKEEGDKKTEGFDDAKKTISDEVGAQKTKLDKVEDEVKTYYEGDTKPSRDDVAKHMTKTGDAEGKDFKTLDESVETQSKTIEANAKKFDAANAEAEKLEAPKGDDATTKTIHIDEEGKVADKAGDTTKEAVISKDKDGKVSVKVDGKDAEAFNNEKTAFEADKALRDSIKELPEKDVEKDAFKGLLESKYKKPSTKFDKAFETIKGAIPKKLTNKTAAIWAGAGAAIVGIAANVMTKKPEGE